MTEVLWLVALASVLHLLPPENPPPGAAPGREICVHSPAEPPPSGVGLVVKRSSRDRGARGGKATCTPKGLLAGWGVFLSTLSQPLDCPHGVNRLKA